MLKFKYLAFICLGGAFDSAGHRDYNIAAIAFVAFLMNAYASYYFREK